MRIAIVTGASSGMEENLQDRFKMYQSLDGIWLVARRTERLKELKEELPIPVRIDGDLSVIIFMRKIDRELFSDKERRPHAGQQCRLWKVGSLKRQNKKSSSVRSA